MASPDLINGIAKELLQPDNLPEAAAWLARLYGPNRTPNADKGFRRWLDLSPEHAHAFERATKTWDNLALLRRRPIERIAEWEQRGFRMSFARAAFAVRPRASLPSGLLKASSMTLVGK